MLLRSASLLSASSIVIVPIPFFNVLFISYRRCCNKSRGKLRFGVLHTFHLKRAACSRRINREIPAFVAGISVSELFKFPVVQQRCDQHHKAGTCMVTTTCATLRWRWEFDMRMEDASTAIAVFPISRRGIFLRNTFQIDEMICADSILLLNFGECPVSFGSDILVCFLWI